MNTEAFENVLKIAEEARFHLKLNLPLPSYFLPVSCHPVISSLSLSFLSFNGSEAGVGFPPLHGPSAHAGFMDSKRVSDVH